MIPPCSWSTPGRNPGTSTKVTSGTLKQSQVRTNRAALVDASMSSAPASTAGCWATIPTLRPPRWANPTMMFCAQPGWISRNSPSSTIASDHIVHVVGLRRIVRHDAVEGRVLSVRRIRRRSRRGGSDRLFCGRWSRIRRAVASASASSRAARCATPLIVVCADRAAEMLGVDILVGHGAYDVGAGDEHVARPFDHHGEVGDGRRVDRSAGARPEDHRELRHDAGCQRVAQEDVGVATERDDAFLDPRAARNRSSPMIGAPTFIARSMTLQIFSA